MRRDGGCPELRRHSSRNHIAAVSQLRYPGERRDYKQMKIAEGKTTKKAIRALKRRISDVVYRHLLADSRHPPWLNDWRVREDTQGRF